MSRDIQLKNAGNSWFKYTSDQFSQGEDLDLDAIIYLIMCKNLAKYTKNLKKTKTQFDAYCHLPFVRALWLL
jgi:hypothetical protein